MKSITILLWTLLSVQQAVICQSSKGFVLTGKFKNMQNGTKVYLITQEEDTVGRCISKGETFVFKGKLSAEGRFHYIRIDSFITSKVAGPIMLMNSHIRIDGELGKSTLQIAGSPWQKDLDELTQVLNESNEKWKLASNEEKEFRKKNTPVADGKDPVLDSMKRKEYEEGRAVHFKKIDSMGKVMPLYLKTWMKSHPESLVPAWFTKAYAETGFEVALMEEIYNQFTPSVKASYYGIESKRIIAAFKASSQIKAGNRIPDFMVTTPGGQEESIRKLISKHTYTLIDFWASWCGPCRAAIPDLKKLYSQYKDQGFHIIGISTDKRETDWEQALRADATEWTQVRDTEKAETELFRLNAIPAYLLVDQNSKLIAFDGIGNIPNFGGGLREAKLKAQLEALFRN